MSSLSRPSTRSRATAMLAAAARFGFRPLCGDDAVQGLRLTARLMNCEVVSSDTLAAVLKRQPSAALGFWHEGEIAGVVATLLMGQRASGALAGGVFDGRSDLAAQICAPAEAPRAYYIWGVAGATRRARWAAMELCQSLRFDVLADLVAYTRAATDDGRRAAIARLGFTPLGGADDSFLVSQPATERLAA